MSTLTEKAKAISRFRKERYLLTFSEHAFRDEVVRPLFLRRGFEDGRDFCGPNESGKDSIFISKDLLGVVDIYAVQTKKGKLNLSRKITQNVVEAATQLKTALSTTVVLVKNKEKKLPTKAILCTSGKTNDTARHYIQSQVNNPGLVFIDSDELIPMIDEVMPEFWFKIDSDAMPYLKALKNRKRLWGQAWDNWILNNSSRAAKGAIGWSGCRPTGMKVEAWTVQIAQI